MDPLRLALQWYWSPTLGAISGKKVVEYGVMRRFWISLAKDLVGASWIEGF